MTPESDELTQQRCRVLKIVTVSSVLNNIKQAVNDGKLLLQPNLEISNDVGAQANALGILYAFNSEYLRLVLEVILKIQIKFTDEAQFVKNLDAIARTYIFHSPAIAKNKKLIYGSGKWLNDEGKKAIARHFLTIMCQTCYLMEECLHKKVISNSQQMFKPDSAFEVMSDVFSFMSREMISGKTLLPRIMEAAEFKPSYFSPLNETELTFVADISHSDSTLRSTSALRQQSHDKDLNTDNVNGTQIEAGQTYDVEKLDAGQTYFVDKAGSSTYTVEKLDAAQTYDVENAGSSTYIVEKLDAGRTYDVENADSCTNDVSKVEQQEDEQNQSLFDQSVADNLDKHAKDLTSYQSNVAALYEQLKHTAEFLSDIVESLGLDNSQIELLKQKIMQLQLDMNETNELSGRIINETRQIAQDLSAMSFRIEQSIVKTRTYSFFNNHPANKALDDLVAKNNELTEKDNLLKEEISGLKRQLDDMRAKYDDLQGRVGALSDENQRLVNEAADAPKVLADLGLNIENHLQHIHDVLSNVTNLRKNH